MPFTVTSAWIVAGAMVFALVAMGVRNHRSGWRRERRDGLLDDLLLWAQAVRPESATAPPVMKESTGASASTTQSLQALGAAVGASVQQVEPVKEPEPLKSERV